MLPVPPNGSVLSACAVPWGALRGGLSLRGFLSDADLGQAQQAARYLCPGSGASVADEAAHGTSIVDELISYTFVEGLQEIEGRAIDHPPLVAGTSGHI